MTSGPFNKQRAQEETWITSVELVGGGMAIEPFSHMDANFSMFEAFADEPWRRYHWGEISNFNQVRCVGEVYCSMSQWRKEGRARGPGLTHAFLALQRCTDKRGWISQLTD